MFLLALGLLQIPRTGVLFQYTDHLLDVLSYGTLADKKALLELHMNDKLGLGREVDYLSIEQYLQDKGYISESEKQEPEQEPATAEAPAQDNGVKPLVSCLADIEPEEVAFLWKPYIPIGKLTLLEGDPGIGKTWAALQIAAAVSKR